MNANPADCACERCEIDRERAPYQLAWLTAFREATTAQVSAALDAVENGSHRDSPEANGALLALTGLMLEKESELSDAVVGGAAGQQDQGEQSPMLAAEMERRIGLMGRLNDAAARRFRRQPAPEVADNGADLWYAACFACTTSLQVVRLFRRQRAELPQRDLMREAYLVVLAQLAMEAEESRERLEETAIPDLDDGLTNARATLLAEAHAAIDEMAETVAADLRAFNQDLPVEIRPAMRGLPAVTERAAAMVIGPADFHVGRFDEWDPNPPHAVGGLYIVYYYRGAKVVQSILDTYPMGFPAAAAQQQVDRVIGALLAMGPEEEALSDLLLPYPLVMSDLADAGLHDVAVDRCSEFVSALQQQDLRHGAMLEVLAAVVGDEPDVSEYLLRDSDFDPEFATVRQARAIITTARRQGLDSVKLSKLAAAMGHEAEELGVTPPSTNYAALSILLGEARAAGFPHEAIDRIYQAIDPDGYAEALYEQAADLREFGDAAADGALEGLPRFDGEFSR